MKNECQSGKNINFVKMLFSQRDISGRFTERLAETYRKGRRFLFWCIMSVCLGAGSAAAQVNAEQVINIGRNVLSMEDYMLAIQYFNQAIKAKPYLADPYLYRAIAKLSLDDYKGAEADCSMAIERNRYKSEAYKVRGFARQNMGLTQEAIKDYDRGLEHNPLDKYFLYYKAIAQTQLKDYEDADSTFSRLLRQYPGFEDGFAARGRMNAERGDTVAALADIDRAIGISKNLVNAYLMRAEIEAKRQEWDKAIADTDEALRLRPQESDLYVNRAFLRYNTDDFFGAMSDYNYALELEPDNKAAIFNRALLRYEVKDLDRAEQDLTKLLTIDKDNFHARYNRGLVRLELGRHADALKDFNVISARYPKFYPVYYAIAECRRSMGDMRGAVANVKKAESLVSGYVKDPSRNALDRPAIAAATSNSHGTEQREDESETDVMDRFNQLVTVGEVANSTLTYNEKIKGRVQDRNVQVEPEPMYLLSFIPPQTSLRSLSNWFRELDDLNTAGYIGRNLYLVADHLTGDDESIRQLFSIADEFSIAMEQGRKRPVDYLARGIVYTQLKNYDSAIADLDRALESNNTFTVAYMARAYARYMEGRRLMASHPDAGDVAGIQLNEKKGAMLLSEVIEDYDKALELNPRLVYAWFNKGNIYYSLGDFTSALQCFGEAIKIDPSFGQAYFNRGLSYLNVGNKNHAFEDLSKAGELGVLPSYNLLKRMK